MRLWKVFLIGSENPLYFLDRVGILDIGGKEKMFDAGETIFAFPIGSDAGWAIRG